MASTAAWPRFQSCIQYVAYNRPPFAHLRYHVGIRRISAWQNACVCRMVALLTLDWFALQGAASSMIVGSLDYWLGRQVESFPAPAHTAPIAIPPRPSSVSAASSTEEPVPINLERRYSLLTLELARKPSLEEPSRRCSALGLPRSTSQPAFEGAYRRPTRFSVRHALYWGALWPPSGLQACNVVW